jgi:glycosyltransferase involved in cell wall biosynthesis
VPAHDFKTEDFGGPARRAAPAGEGPPGHSPAELVVLCAANPWDAVKMMDQHLAEHLSRLTPLLYVDPPRSLLAPLRNWDRGGWRPGSRLRRLGPGLDRLTVTATPGPLRPGLLRLSNAAIRHAIRRRASVAGGARAVIATMPLVEPFGCCQERLRVYWAQDDFVAGAELFGLSGERIRKTEARVAAAADVIVASNPEVAEGWRRRGYDVRLIPFGCDYGMFANSDTAAPAADVFLTPPVAGFVGHVNERIDLSLLEAVAQRGISLLLVGPRHSRYSQARMERLLSLPNVQWVGPKRFEELPSYQRVIDVGLVPYGRTPFNLGSFPLKTLEYLAAGRAVVATDLPATRWLATDLITIESEPAAFAEAVAFALRQSRSPSIVASRRAFAAQHSWASRADSFAGVLGVERSSAEEPAGAAPA